jgi:AraC family transcriptional regulator
MRHLDLLTVLQHIGRESSHDVSLGTLATQAGWSPFHFHRTFRALTSETPRQYTERLRLEHAAGQLLVSEGTVLEIALAAGFGSHEVFTRAFRRHFGCTPSCYRATALAGASEAERARHVALTQAIGACIRLFHCSIHSPRSRPMPVLSITRQDRPAQPILLIRRRVAPSELQATLAECFGTLFGHGQHAGLPIAGQPLARYLSRGPGLCTIEAAMPLTTPVVAAGEMEPGTLPGGPVAVGVHGGPYEQLPDTHAAIERWIEANGLRASGAPWESYITDPAQHPDPRDWRTEVCWPLAG